MSRLTSIIKSQNHLEFPVDKTYRVPSSGPFLGLPLVALQYFLEERPWIRVAPRDARTSLGNQ